jgi:hypothetical protein
MRWRLLAVVVGLAALLAAADPGRRPRAPVGSGFAHKFLSRPAAHWRLALRAGCFERGPGCDLWLHDRDGLVVVRPGTDASAALASVLRGLLPDPDPHIRWQAVRWLVCLEGHVPATTQTLAGLLDDPDPAVRWESARHVRFPGVAGHGVPIPVRARAARIADAGPPPDFPPPSLARLAPAEVRRLCGWPGVRAVSAGPGLTDAEVAELADVPDLIWADLRGTRVTDAGLARVERLPGLRVLDVSGATVTANGVERLRVARPDLDVRWR